MCKSRAIKKFTANITHTNGLEIDLARLGDITREPRGLVVKMVGLLLVANGCSYYSKHNLSFLKRPFMEVFMPSLSMQKIMFNLYFIFLLLFLGCWSNSISHITDLSKWQFLPTKGIMHYSNSQTNISCI